MPPRSRTTAHDADAGHDDTTKGAGKAAEAREDAETDRAQAESEDRSSGTEYLNVSGGPVVYDSHGHQVASGEWVTTTLDKVGQAARRNGYLLPRSAL